MLTESPLNGVRIRRRRALRLKPWIRRRYSPPWRACRTTTKATTIMRPMPTSQTVSGTGELSSGPWAWPPSAHAAAARVSAATMVALRASGHGRRHEITPASLRAPADLCNLQGSGRALRRDAGNSRGARQGRGRDRSEARRPDERRREEPEGLTRAVNQETVSSRDHGGLGEREPRGRLEGPDDRAVRHAAHGDEHKRLHDVQLGGQVLGRASVHGTLRGILRSMWIGNDRAFHRVQEEHATVGEGGPGSAERVL